MLCMRTDYLSYQVKMTIMFKLHEVKMIKAAKMINAAKYD